MYRLKKKTNLKCALDRKNVITKLKLNLFLYQNSAILKNSCSYIRNNFKYSQKHFLEPKNEKKLAGR